MRPTKMLPVRGSLREFQELHSSSQDLQNQRPPHQLLSGCSKETLTKKVAGLICLAWVCSGTVFVEYEMLRLCDAAFVVSAAACAVAVTSGALYRAPEGDERADGLHIRGTPSRHGLTKLRSTLHYPAQGSRPVVSKKLVDQVVLGQKSRLPTPTRQPSERWQSGIDTIWSANFERSEVVSPVGCIASKVSV
jgi:hypothetical protein